ncbi:MAG: hypothetical protein ACJAT4_001384 [Granulosicoccus sp.]|jgi:hypothetical protein
MKKILFIVSLTFVGFIFSCKNTNSSESTQQTEPNSSEGESTENTTTQEKAPTILYAWVDKLRIREQPTTKSEIVAEVKEGTSFTYLNEKTDYKERINLRGTLFNEPWLKITTDDGKEGWVYGGAVKFYEPVVDTNPSPYDACFELKKNGSWEKFHACSEKVRAKQLKKDAQYVSENAEGITLTLLTGKTVEFKNSTPDPNANDEFIQKKYLEYLPKVGFFIFRNNYYEGGDYSLVNDKSGKETTIAGFPKLAPDAKYLIATNQDAVAGFEFNGIQIFGFPNGRFEKLLEKNFEDMEPHTPKWIDHKTIEISMIPSDADKETKPSNIKVIMNEKGDWEIKE